MVRSKEVPKRPKDPLMTPPSKPRGFRDDDGGSLPRNRGGAAMSPAPASVPNYMRATSSSGAKAGRRGAGAVPSSASPTSRRGPVRVVTRGRVLFPTPEVPGMVRPTCSSTMKEAKFPGALDLAPGATDAQGPAAMRVCPYNYCSLNGHAHSPAVPLRSFLASRRRLIKTQQSMKHKGVSAFRKGSGHQRPEDQKSSPVVSAAVAKAAPLVDEEALGDFFVEVYAGPRVSSDMSCSDMSLDEMDAAVRRMEFVVFDRCGVGEEDEKGGDPAARGHGHGHGDGRPEEEDRLGFCRDSSSECSDEGVPGLISGNIVEELPWMRYQGYECDSLYDDVSEERENVQEAEVSEGRSRGSGDNHEEDADEEQKPEDGEITADPPRETGIVADEEGVVCGVEVSEDWQGRDEGDDIANTMDQQEAASTVQETQYPEEDEERVSDIAHKMEIAAAQSCVVCAAEVRTEQEEEEEEDQDNIQRQVIQGYVSIEPGTSEEKLSIYGSEIPETEIAEREEKLSIYGSEIPETEVAERVENVLEESREEEGSADQEAKDDQSNVESTGNLEVAEKQDMPDDGSEMEISETVHSAACEEDFVQEELASKADSEGEISDPSAVASPDVEMSTPPTEGGFEQDENTVEDAFEEYPCSAVNDLVDLFIPTEDTVDVTEDAQKEIEITSCNLEAASDEAGTAQESSQEVDLDNNLVYVGEVAQVQSEVDTSELVDTSEESGIAHEIGEDDNCAYVSDDAQSDSGIATCELGKESAAVQEADHDDNCTDVNGGSTNESALTPCELAEASEAYDITQEAIQDENTSDVKDDAQKESDIIACESEHAREESDITQEGSQEDDKTPGAVTDALMEPAIIMSVLPGACEEICTTDEANLSTAIQIPEHNSDFSEPQNLPAEDAVAKQFSIDDMCDVFSGMHLKGEVTRRRIFHLQGLPKLATDNSRVSG
ncbi:hypothetical protein ZWY2020_043027 [Hordeum vulgare]|nr:hypothetical protein ZWY2020_043027 [Hordeum vulgare]